MIEAVTKEKHLNIITESKSAKFPNGCAKTALKNLLEKIDGATQGEEERLIASFESVYNLGSRKNPEDYIDQLKLLQSKLRTKYNYEKSDKDIVNQVLKALGNQPEYAFIKARAKEDRRNKQEIVLNDLEKSLKEAYYDMKDSKKKKKNISCKNPALKKQKLNKKNMACKPK